MQTLSRLLLAVMVSVLILQTPIPVAHAHVDLEREAVLQRHLVRHHPHELVPDQDLHWHLFLPGQADDFDPCHRDHDPAPWTWVSSTSVNSTSANSCEQFATLECDWLGGDRSPGDLLSRLQVFSTLGVVSRSSLSGQYALTSPKRSCALLCVIRC